MYNLNEIVVDYRCMWTQHLLRMNDTFPNLHMNTFQRAEGTWDDLERPAPINTLRTGLLNCLNARSCGLKNVIQLLYCVSLKIYNKFANYFCELKFSENTHQRP